jgi:hypothetical protein
VGREEVQEEEIACAKYIGKEGKGHSRSKKKPE